MMLSDPEFCKVMDDNFNALSLDVVEKAKVILLDRIPETDDNPKVITRKFIAALVEKHGLSLWFNHLFDELYEQALAEGDDKPFLMSPHMSFGMWVRNQLRMGGVKDNMVPDGNLDDYYVAMIEYALGHRPAPTGGTT
jgi:hypothetical protein